MKRKWIWLVIAFFLVLPVKAKEYNVNELIAVDEIATVKTEKFDYADFTFSSQLDAKGNGIITFQSITNNTLSKKAVSINILLFDNKKLNIGFLTYCSNKDYDTNYSGFQLGGKESAPFVITAYSKYFGESKKTAQDVAYIAVMDENELCRIGGYSNYLGKTIEEINNPTPVEPSQAIDFDFKMPELPSFLKNQKIWTYSLIGFCAFLVLIGTGAFFNVLYKKMYGKKTFFAYLPITNIYVSVKSVFGRIVAIIFFLCVIASGVLYYFRIKIALYIMAVLWLISIILIIVKLITKNYDLFYFEPSMNDSMEKSKEDFKHISKEENMAPLDLDYEGKNIQDISSDTNISSGAGLEKEEKQQTEIDLEEDSKKEEGLDDFF